MTVTLPSLGVVNAQFLTSQLLVGGDLAADDQLAEAQLSELLTAGVGHIVDARVEWTDAEFVARIAPHVAYSHVGIDDAGQVLADSWFDEVTALISTSVAAGQVVLVHCHMGINRGPSLALAVLLQQGWDVVAAMDLIRTSRPVAAMAYAENALDWHHRRTGAGAAQRRTDRDRVAAWRRDNPLDVVRIIRSERWAESAQWEGAGASRYLAC